MQNFMKNKSRRHKTNGTQKQDLTKNTPIRGKQKHKGIKRLYP